jgi:hypothetical protein
MSENRVSSQIELLARFLSVMCEKPWRYQKRYLRAQVAPARVARKVVRNGFATTYSRAFPYGEGKAPLGAGHSYPGGRGRPSVRRAEHALGIHQRPEDRAGGSQ